MAVRSDGRREEDEDEEGRDAEQRGGPRRIDGQVAKVQIHARQTPSPGRVLHRMTTPYAELHCHSNFSFLDGASPVEDLVARAVELGLSGLAITDHGGLYGVVRFATEAEAAGLRPILGLEIELVDAAVPDPAGVVIPARRRRRPERVSPAIELPIEGLPARPRPSRTRLPGHRGVVKEDLRGIGERQRGPHLVLLARDVTGYRSLCRLISRANLAGTKAVPLVVLAPAGSNGPGNDRAEGPPTSGRRTTS